MIVQEAFFSPEKLVHQRRSDLRSGRLESDLCLKIAVRPGGAQD
jgi:hypothetical protein